MTAMVPSRSPVMQEDKFAEFMRRRLKDKPKMVVASLVHLVMPIEGQGGGGDVILSHTFVSSDPETLEKEIVETAREFADEALCSIQTHTSGQRYAIVASSKGDVPIGRHEFFLAPPPNNTFSSGVTEPANATGALAMTMRLADGQNRITMLERQEIMSRLLEENDRLRQENRHLREGHFAIIERTEELLSRKQERDMAIEAARAERGRADRLLGHVEELVPHLLSRYGVSFNRTVSNKGAAKINQLLSTLTPQQQEVIFNTLSPEQLQALHDAMMGDGESEANGAASHV